MVLLGQKKYELAEWGEVRQKDRKGGRRDCACYGKVLALCTVEEAVNVFKKAGRLDLNFRKVES